MGICRNFFEKNLDTVSLSVFRYFFRTSFKKHLFLSRYFFEKYLYLETFSKKIQILYLYLYLDTFFGDHLKKPSVLIQIFFEKYLYLDTFSKKNLYLDTFAKNDLYLDTFSKNDLYLDTSWKINVSRYFFEKKCIQILFRKKYVVRYFIESILEQVCSENCFSRDYGSHKKVA